MTAIHEALDRFWSSLDEALPTSLEETIQLQFRTALAEIAANMASHAHPRGHPPGSIVMTLSATSDRVEAHLHDHGIPFVLPETPFNASDDPDLLSETGRGFTIARLILDEIHYTREGTSNHWHLVKRISP